MNCIGTGNLSDEFNSDKSKVKRPLQGCFSSMSVEWNTPGHIIHAVTSVLKSIDLDPCSNSRANPNIPAKKLYTKDDNGLDKIWVGRIYMNPPYGRQILAWVKKLHEEYNDHNVKEAIALLPARTDTAWFKILRKYPRCFIYGRLKFGNAKNSAPFPSVVVYLGHNAKTFQRVFSELGDVYILMCKIY
jgi:hypothetical protein